MVMRIKKNKKTKKLGHRTFGRGNVKNRRGSGNRGGFGKAGFWKHKKTSWVGEKEEFLKSKKGFKVEKKRLPVINLYQIQKMIDQGKIDRQGDEYVFTFQGKLLSLGELSLPVTINVLAASNRAIEKVEKLGGKVVILNK